MFRGAGVRSVFAGFLTYACSACSSAPPADAPDGHGSTRILVDAILFDVASDQNASIGSADPKAALYDLAIESGARHVVSPHVLAADGGVARLPSLASPSNTQDAVEAALTSYQLELTAHVVESGRVHLDVNLELAGKRARAVVVVDDKQRIVLTPDVMVENRRFVVVVQPNIIRSDADLRAIYDELLAQRDARARRR